MGIEGGVGHGAVADGVGFHVAVELRDQPRELPFRLHPAMLAARAGVIGVFERPGREAAHLDHAVRGLAVQGGQHLQERLPVQAELLARVIHRRLVPPGRQVEEKRPPRDEIVVVGQRMQVPLPRVGMLNPECVNVIGGKARVALARVNELPDGPAVSVIFRAAGRRLAQVGNQPLARELGRAVRVYQPEPNWQPQLASKQSEHRIGRPAEPHRQQAIAAGSRGSNTRSCRNLRVIDDEALDVVSETCGPPLRVS